MNFSIPPIDVRRRQLNGALLGLLLFWTGACRSTPPAPPTVESQPQAEIARPMPQTEVPATVTVEAKPKIEPAPPLAPAPKPTISRLLPESMISPPEKDLASRRLAYNTILSGRAAAAPNTPSWQYRRTQNGPVVGFEFSNHGGNRILPPRRDASKNQFFTRDFQFRFDERARQDIYLLVTDWVPSRDRQFRLSDLMNRLMLFFPRNFLPAIVAFEGRNLVTLPTGEAVEFDGSTHEILAGALVESPVDLNPDRATRKFPGVEYSGHGVMVRADGRGADPRVGTTAIITPPSSAPDCDKGAACKLCRVASGELWHQTGALRFKFATDQEFNAFLIARCRFGLPKALSGFAVAPPVK